MNPSYFRIKLAKAQAAELLCAWCGKQPRETVDTGFGEAVDVSVDENGQWKGNCLYMYENGGWTVFEDLSGGFAGVSAEKWLEFAGVHDFVSAGYNDSIPYAELVVITGGAVRKEFLDIPDEPESNVNMGDMYPEVASWEDAAAFVDDDDLVYSDSGTVLIF